MWKARWMVVVGMLCVACGGGGNSYGDAMDAQLDVMEEIVSVLEGVTDESSARAAAPEIEALGNRLAEVASEMKDLPPPEMKEMQELAEKHRKRVQEIQGKASTQLVKLGEYDELMQAYARAMTNMK